MRFIEACSTIERDCRRVIDFDRGEAMAFSIWKNEPYREKRQEKRFSVLSSFSFNVIS